MISFIIPTLNEAAYITPTLQALVKLQGVPYEIIVSDGGSTDTTQTQAQAYTPRIITSSKQHARQGISTGKNLGAKQAQGDWLVFLDADVYIPDITNFFLSAFRIIQSHPRLVGLTVRLRVMPELETVRDRIFFGLLNFYFLIYNNLLHIGNAPGEFQMIQAEAFKKLGGYREDLAAGEDMDMFNRLSKIGKTKVATNLLVYHSGRRAHTIGWAKLLYRWCKNGLYISLFNKSAFKEWEIIR